MRSAEIAVAGGAPERIETRVTRWGPVVADGLARPAARAARDVARAAGARPRHRGPRGSHRRRERERAPGALGGTVAELGARRPRRRHRVGRQRPAAAPRRVRRLAARVARRRQPLVARQAAAAGRARRPRRRAVHGQQPHAAARARRRREPHVDAAAACETHRRFARGAPRRSTSATSSRCSSTRAPKATSRSARRFSTSSPPSEPEPLLARARELASDWNGHADVDQPAFRILHAYYRALLERTLEPLLAPAIAADASFVYRWPLADEVAAAAARRTARASS